MNSEKSNFTLTLLHQFKDLEPMLTMLKAHCRGADWINKTIKKKRIRQGSVISLYRKIHEDDNDLIRNKVKSKK